MRGRIGPVHGGRGREMIPARAHRGNYTAAVGEAAIPEEAGSWYEPRWTGRTRIQYRFRFRPALGIPGTLGCMPGTASPRTWRASA
jgi:hypothetical protein